MIPRQDAIAVQKKQEVTGGYPCPAVTNLSQAKAVVGLRDQPDGEGSRCGIRSHDGGGFVGGAVIGHDHFHVSRDVLLQHNRFQHQRQMPWLLVGVDDQRKSWNGVGHPRRLRTTSAALEAFSTHVACAIAVER